MRHADRVSMILRRVSRNRVLHAKEANELSVKIANKISGQPSSTLCALGWPLRQWQRYVNGEFVIDNVISWNELESDARSNQCQFCLIAARETYLRRQPYILMDKLKGIRSLISKAKKEIRNVENTQYLR